MYTTSANSSSTDYRDTHNSSHLHFDQVTKFCKIKITISYITHRLSTGTVKFGQTCLCLLLPTNELQYYSNTSINHLKDTNSVVGCLIQTSAISVAL